MATLSDIRDDIFKNNETKRIIVRVRAESLDSQGYHALAYKVINEVFPGWESDTRVLFLAIEIWRNRMFLAVDIHNHDYDFNTAHRTKTVLPVYILRQHRGDKQWALIRWRREDVSLAEKLAYLHNANGFDGLTPFLENHNSRVVHANPREFPI